MDRPNSCHVQEHLDLTAFVQEANKFRQDVGPIRLENLPIFGMTKGTALAIRYTYSTDQVISTSYWLCDMYS